MSFPLIRPEQAEAMTARERAAHLRWLKQDMKSAAERHRRILTERAARVLAEELAASQQVEARDVDWTPQEREEAEQMLAANRTLIALGRRHGDGSPDDDLRAAYTAVHRGGSTNRYLVALARENQRRRMARYRASRAAMSNHPTPDRRTA